MSEEQRFRGVWTPRVEKATSEGKEVVKLVCGTNIRLVEMTEVTLAEVRGRFAEMFDAEECELMYSIPGDEDEITIASDSDLRLAVRFGGRPLKIVARPKLVRPVGDVFECAQQCLRDQGVEAPSGQIKLVLDTLKLQPRRLVKYGLAPPCALKEPQDEEWEAVDKVTKMTIAEAVPVEAVEEDCVVASMRAAGVTLEATTLHALLRVLDVPPQRFVKVGLIEDVAEVRKAYKKGGAEAAKVVIKGNPKKWGRGLCGGRGRGRGHGWAYEQHLPGKHRKVHHHHHHHGPHHFHGPPHHFHGPPHHFHGPPHHFHGPPHHFHGPPHHFHGPPPHFRGPPPPHFHGRPFGGGPPGHFDE